MNWNIIELKKLLKERYDPDIYEKIEKHISSVAWKINISRYHGYTARNSFNELFSGIPKSEQSLQAIKYIFSSGDEKFTFNKLMTEAEANTIALAQSMYSVSDLISYVIFTIILDNHQIRDIKIHEVHKALPKSSMLKRRIVELTGMKEFMYLKDFVNQTKHVSLIPTGYFTNTQDISKNEHGMKFRAFTFSHEGKAKPRHHPEKYYKDFFEEMDMILKKYIEVCCEINNFVKKA